MQSCTHYGDSFLVLKRVRLRTSFASCDTACDSAQISSCEWYAHVLMEYQDNEILDTLTAAQNPTNFGSSMNLGTYKEVQIHGPVAFAEHVSYAVINPRHKIQNSIMDMIDNWSSKNAFPYIFIGDPLPKLVQQTSYRPSKELAPIPSTSGTSSPEGTIDAYHHRTSKKHHCIIS